MRVAIAAAVTCLCIIGVTATAQVQAAIRIHTEIPAEPLDLALRTLAKERGFQLVYLTDNVAMLKTHGAIGDLTVDEALKLLLSDSRLEYKFVDDKTVSIFPKTDSTSALGNDQLLAEGGGPHSSGSPPKRSSGNVRLAQANQGVAQSSSTVASDVQSASENSVKSPGLTEIVVTAQKKAEREQDVPIAMTVLDPQTLSENGQYRLADYYATVPGLSVNSGTAAPGTQYVTIRGLSTSAFQNSTVATLIDGIPTGSGTQLQEGNLTSPDIDPSDLARIEVLKGPQGTLYGADSLGGLINYVTVDPSTSRLSGRVEVSGVDVPIRGAGYSFRASVNIPISDSFAIRASGFSRRDPGYVDNLTSGQSNVNSANVYGGRAAALWKPSDDLSLKVSALIQQTDGNGTPYFDAQISPNGTVQPTLGYLKQTGERYANPYTTQEQLYSATLHAKAAGLDLVSVTGYSVNKLHNWSDIGSFLNTTLNVMNTGLEQNNDTRKISQELRLSSSIGQRLDWLVGAFYTHESVPSSAFQSFGYANLATGAIEGLEFADLTYPYTFSEEAIFADFTVHFTDRFNVQIGARESWNRMSYSNTYVGPDVLGFFGVAAPYVQPTLHASGNAFTYLVTPQFQISQDAMVYARVASGYRIGGANSSATVYPNTPSEYKPDTTVNYEIGFKGNLFERRVSIEADVYYIRWHDFQINVLQGTSDSFITNAGNAKSEGVELAVQVHPATGLTITAQGSFNDAELTQNLPANANSIYGVAGDTLPYSMRWSGGITANQDVPVWNAWTGFVGGAFTYAGLRYGEFAAYCPPANCPPAGLVSPRPLLPGYSTVNLHMGARKDSWLINMYLNNVADRRGIVGVEPGAPAVGNTGGYFGTVIQPRTIGLSLARNF